MSQHCVGVQTNEGVLCPMTLDELIQFQLPQTQNEVQAEMVTQSAGSQE